jgi:hypothetical protein
MASKPHHTEMDPRHTVMHALACIAGILIGIVLAFGIASLPVVLGSHDETMPGTSSEPEPSVGHLRSDHP